jgi:integrase
LLISQGAHRKLIQTRLGHSSITDTLDTYGHLFPSVEAALAEQLDAVYEAAGNPDNVRELRKAE